MSGLKRYTWRHNWGPGRPLVLYKGPLPNTFLIPHARRPTNTSTGNGLCKTSYSATLSYKENMKGSVISNQQANLVPGRNKRKLFMLCSELPDCLILLEFSLLRKIIHISAYTHTQKKANNVFISFKVTLIKNINSPSKPLLWELSRSWPDACMPAHPMQARWERQRGSILSDYVSNSKTGSFWQGRTYPWKLGNSFISSLEKLLMTSVPITFATRHDSAIARI